MTEPRQRANTQRGLEHGKPVSAREWQRIFQATSPDKGWGQLRTPCYVNRQNPALFLVLLEHWDKAGTDYQLTTRIATLKLDLSDVVERLVQERCGTNAAD
jgi:hypothetical protein